MDELAGRDPFYGVFRHHASAEGRVRIERQPGGKRTIPDPQTGRHLDIATVELSGAICPACERRGEGGFISFVSDLRLVFACPHCVGLVWINGA